MRPSVLSSHSCLGSAGKRIAAACVIMFLVTGLITVSTIANFSPPLSVVNWLIYLVTATTIVIQVLVTILKAEVCVICKGRQQIVNSSCREDGLCFMACAVLSLLD